MKYTLEELHDIILPMIQSLGSHSPEELAGALVELIRQDREVHFTAPTSNLDDKLRELLEDWYPGTQYNDVIPKIKRAFSEAGAKLPDNQGIYHISNAIFVGRNNKLDGEAMTGQEWYERFAELIKDHGFYERVTEEFVHEAARRAAGLEQ